MAQKRSGLITANFGAFIQALFTVLLIEFIYRGSFKELYYYIDELTKPFVYNCLLLFLLFSGIRVFKNKMVLALSAIITIPLLILAFGSKVKQEIRGEPILPSDLFLASEAKNMMSFFSSTAIIWLIIIMLLIVILIVIAIYKIPNQNKRSMIQICISSIFLILGITLFIVESRNIDSFLKKELRIVNVAWDQKATYGQDGVLAGFILNLNWLIIEEPNNYSKEKINEIQKNNQPQKFENSTKPDIIMIMSEAYWDPTLLKKVKFNQDPLPFFHQLAQEHTSGYVSVPVFGGSTVNTEFEALTGMTTQFLPPGVIPYLTYIHKPLPALPNILRSHGYETTAIHTYHNWFYQRTSVFRYLGFDQFIPLEFMGNQISGPIFMKDQMIVDEILKKLDSEDTQPNFIFAITTQNHGPYNSEEKPEDSLIEVELNGDQDLTMESDNLLVNYSNNLVEIDSELNRLIKELEARNNDTILVYFGDHLPLLGDDYKVYREAGFYDEDGTYEENKRMYSTPLLIWDNFSESSGQINISPFMLAPIVLDRANLNGNVLTDYLINQYKSNELTKIPRQDFWDEENIKENTLTNYKLLQYDILFGKKYLLKDKNEIKVSKNYRLGYQDPIITNVIRENRDGEGILIIKGKYFTPYSNIFINGKKIDRKSGNEEEIIVADPGEKGDLEIVVKVTDTNSEILAESNVHILK